MHRNMLVVLFCITVLGSSTVNPLLAQKAKSQTIDVAMVTYNRGKTAACFATKFLDLAVRKGKIDVTRSLIQLPLETSDLSKFPMVIFSGDLRFKLSDVEATKLRHYMLEGGFVLASAGCSNEIWNASFNKAMKQVFPKSKFKELSMKHPIFHTLYDLKQINSTKTKMPPKLYGLTVNDQLVMVYSPIGVNDTAHAGGDCCCCGGEEILQSHLVNANILAYILTH